MDFFPRKKLCQWPEDDMACQLHDSVTKVHEVWTRLVGIEKITSWQELFDEILSKEHHPAFRCRKDLVEGTVRLLADTLFDPGCDSVEDASRVINLLCTMLTVLDRTSYLESECFPFEDVFSTLRVDIKPCGVGVNCHYLYNAFKYVDEQLMRILVTYGLAVPPEEFGLTYQWEWISILRDIGLDAVQSHSKTLQLQQIGGRQNERGFSRVAHIVRSLETAWMTLCGEESKGEAYARILEQFFNTLPDPLVTVEEVREFLLQQLEDWPDEADRMVRAFVRLFGEHDRYEPRSLYHLSRCKVRETLMQNASVTLPCAVGRLRIPSLIKDYVLVGVQSENW